MVVPGAFMLDLDERCLGLHGYIGHELQIADFATLRAFDETRYALHERACRLDDPTYQGRPYRGSLFFHEIELQMDGRYRSVWLSMAASYIFGRLCDCSSELLKQHIPYRYVPGHHHRRIEGRNRRWDIRIDANGREPIVEGLQRRIWAYEQERLDALLTRWDAMPKSCVYVINNCDGPATKTHIVFSDKQTLARIRRQSFLVDCLTLAKSVEALEEATHFEKRLLARFIAAQCNELACTSEPNLSGLQS